MMVDAIVLNGGSGSGKSSLARSLQKRLGPTCLILGVKNLIRALPGGDGPVDAKNSIEILADGSISTGDAFRRAEAAWYQGLVAIARSRIGLIIDEVFLDGRRSQERCLQALSNLAILWVGVRCDSNVAEAHEAQRPDRTAGMARQQADQVHEGVIYDIVVDTSSTSVEECADAVIAHLVKRDTTTINSAEEQSSQSTNRERARARH
jgi:chloramphenicol 3-O phosphotransferase